MLRLRTMACPGKQGRRGELFTEAGFCSDPAALFDHPETEVCDRQGGCFLADSEALVGGGVSDLGHDLLDFRNSVQSFRGDLRAVSL